jgi:hypothetical protein
MTPQSLQQSLRLRQQNTTLCSRQPAVAKNQISKRIVGSKQISVGNIQLKSKALCKGQVGHVKTAFISAHSRTSAAFVQTRFNAQLVLRQAKRPASLAQALTEDDGGGLEGIRHSTIFVKCDTVVSTKNVEFLRLQNND